MTVPTIPENAPFTPAQRAWLNGFFAGLVSTGRAGGDTAEAQVAGSAAALPESAGAEAGAEAPEAAQEAKSWRDVQDEDPDQYPWHDSDVSLEKRLELVEDKPLDLKLMGAMAQLDCGQCGYLCRTYAKAIETGEETDLKRCVPGGKQTAKALKQILADHEAASGEGGGGADPKASSPSEAESASAPAEGAPDGPPHDRDRPFPAPVLAVERLTGARSMKDTRFVSLSLAGSGLTYRAGDALGVYPKNPYDRVDALIRLLGLGGGERVALAAGDSVTLRTALIEHADIKTPSDELYELLAACAADAQEAADLRRCVDEQAVDGLIAEPRVIDVLARFPSARPDPEALVGALDPLRPRLYSIASSPLVYPDEIHLVVGVVRYEQGGAARKGVASTFLADRVADYEPVPAFVQASEHFAPPAEDDKPMIMVGPGTGIAPFRAFVQERKARGASGANWLFFGEQHAATDYLFGDELAELHAAGWLGGLTTAFSRDGEKRVYVQDRMREHGAELWRRLADGGHFYVCGDAERMAPDVDKALHEIVAEHGDMSAESAADFVQRMKSNGRYQRDVY